MLVMLATVAATVNLYIKTPQGLLPAGRHRPDLRLHPRRRPTSPSTPWSSCSSEALEIVLADPAVAGVGSSVGASGWNASVNQGRMFISLKPLSERGGLTTQRITDRLRRAALGHRGPQRLVLRRPGHPRRRAPGPRRSTSSRFWSPDFDVALRMGAEGGGAPRARCRGSPTSPPTASRAACRPTSSIDRQAAARLGVNVQDINSALNNAFSQRQISTVYTERNQYRVVLEVDAGVPARPVRSLAHLRARAATACRCRSTAW